MDNNAKKEERFRRLAPQRTNSVLKKLKTLGNCSNRSTYSYSEEDINKIFSELEKAVMETKAKFYFSSHKKFEL